jgi:6,7-dimethyl-8-ribityllumazine synthase
MSTPPRILVVEARFYPEIADELVKGAIAALEAAGANWRRLAVPGAFELPAAVAMAIETGEYDGYVALGCVIRGDTSHYDLVCSETARGLSELALRHQIALGFGVLTCDNAEQAWERASVTRRNRGRDAALACLAMVAFARSIAERTP